MPIPTIPTAAEIKARIIADIENELNQTTPALFKAFNRVLAGAIAGFILAPCIAGNITAVNTTINITPADKKI